MARRRHPAAATRILVGGFAVASTLGIVSALALDAPVAGSAAPVAVTPTVPTTAPPPTVRQVYRYVPVPAGGGTSSGGGSTSSGSTRTSSGGSSAAAPSGSAAAPAPVVSAPSAPAPVTVTRGS